MDAFAIGRSGLDAAMRRLTASASRIANAASTGPVPGSATAAAPNVNVTDELVETMSAKLAAEANLKVISTAADLQKRSLELWG